MEFIDDKSLKGVGDWVEIVDPSKPKANTVSDIALGYDS